jgi:hypothetical protein
VVCSGNTTSAAEMSSRDQMEDDLDHMLRFLCGVCRGNLDRDFMALERSSPCISLRVSGDRCRIVRGLISWDVKTQCHLLFPDADQGTAEEPRRSCVAPHLTCLKRLHPVFLASSYFPSPRAPDCSSSQSHVSLRPQSTATIMLSCTPSRRLESLER